MRQREMFFFLAETVCQLRSENGVSEKPLSQTLLRHWQICTSINNYIQSSSSLNRFEFLLCLSND